MTSLIMDANITSPDRSASKGAVWYAVFILFAILATKLHKQTGEQTTNRNINKVDALLMGFKLHGDGVCLWLCL